MAAGLGQPAAAAAMYGYGGHQLEDLAALQRSTLAASLPQLVGSHSAAAGQPGGSGAAGSSQIPAKGVSTLAFLGMNNYSLIKLICNEDLRRF